jgi:hypothetical protein
MSEVPRPERIEATLTFWKDLIYYVFVQSVEKNAGHDLACDAEQRDATMVITT